MAIVRALAMAWVLSIALSLQACGDDDNPTDVVTYDIRIVNETSLDLEIWIDPDVDAPGFFQQGTVPANSTRVLESRAVEVGYLIRLVEPGDDLETEFAYETTIRSSGEDQIWTVGP